MDSQRICTGLRFLKLGPYIDASWFSTLPKGLDHYNVARLAPAGHSELNR
jgi:hypothetical protein